jgi:hypothetical protein
MAQGGNAGSANHENHLVGLLGVHLHIPADVFLLAAAFARLCRNPREVA